QPLAELLADDELVPETVILGARDLPLQVWKGIAQESAQRRGLIRGQVNSHMSLPDAIIAPRAWLSYPLSSLNACDHRLLRKPGIHQRMHSGSIARAASTVPMSAVSQPN